MKNKSTLQISFLFVLIALSDISFAQSNFKKGYIINNSNDTTYGLINLGTNYMNARTCEFRLSEECNITQYGPKDIKAYMIPGRKYYISKTIELDSNRIDLFLEYLIEGSASLYYFDNSGNRYFFIAKDDEFTELSNDISIIEGPGGEKLHRESNQYKRTLSYLFKDVDEYKTKINDTKFNNSGLVNLITNYNVKICNDSNCINYTKKYKRPLIYEPFIGYSYATIFASENSTKLYSSGYHLGLLLLLQPFENSNNWHFVLGFSVNKHKIKGRIENVPDIPSPNILDLNVAFSDLLLQLKIRYTLPLKSKLKPYISAGNTAVLSIPVGTVVRPVFESNIPYDHIPHLYHSGFTPGIGVKYYMKNENYLLIETSKVKDDLSISFGCSLLVKL